MLEWVRLNDCDALVTWIPHPSGRNHFYNKRSNAMKVGRFLRELA